MKNKCAYCGEEKNKDEIIFEPTRIVCTACHEHYSNLSVEEMMKEKGD